MPPPVVVLVEPALPENVGAVARILANFGVPELRLVAPACDPGHPQAIAVATHGAATLAAATVWPDLASAVADCTGAWAACSLPRYGQKVALGPRELASELRAAPRAALVLGPERTGLRADHLDRCTGLVRIPTEPDARALNLAQAAAVLVWEWRAPDAPPPSTPPAAPLAEQTAWIDRFERELLRAGWLSDPAQREKTSRNLRTALLRAGFTRAELRTLHGALRALVGAREAPEPP